MKKKVWFCQCEFVFHLFFLCRKQKYEHTMKCVVECRLSCVWFVQTGKCFWRKCVNKHCILPVVHSSGSISRCHTEQTEAPAMEHPRTEGLILVKSCEQKASSHTHTHTHTRIELLSWCRCDNKWKRITQRSLKSHCWMQNAPPGIKRQSCRLFILYFLFTVLLLAFMLEIIFSWSLKGVILRLKVAETVDG